MPLRGVRNSCDMFDRKRDLASLAAMALARLSTRRPISSTSAAHDSTISTLVTAAISKAWLRRET